MRIAYIAADRGTPVFGSKGASVHIRSMVNALVQLGHELVVYAACRGEGDEPLHASVVEVSLDNPAPSPAEGDARREAKERRSMTQATLLAQRVAADHGERPFELIYERYALFSSAAVDLSRQLGVPGLVEVNAPLIEEQLGHRRLINRIVAEDVRNRVFAGADHLLPVSDGVQAYCLAHGAAPDRVSVIENGIDAELFHPGAEPVVLPELYGKTVIGFSGSLKPWHGLEHLLRAFRTAASGHPERHLLIVGDGPMRGWIEGFAAGAGLEQQISITGWIALAEMPSYLRRMDVAVAPYPPSDDFYFSPLKLYEYLGCGLPVVASRIGQIATTLRDGQDALLVRPGDEQQLAEALVRLCTHPELRQRLAGAAALTGARRTWLNNARRVLAIAQGTRVAERRQV